MRTGWIFVFASGITLLACRDHAAKWSAALTGGDPARGRSALTTYGCIACHTVPGVRGSNVLSAPPLIGISKRTYLAGMLENTPENLQRWIQHPRQINPRTAMPEQGVTDQDARDIAAYLYTTP
ncbi:MAG TPA: c-type cytochrome [Candidatus Udaeobacter sp.]|nr:c-type cytochrome [Candidatus Udaeobacter sp.]